MLSIAESIREAEARTRPRSFVETSMIGPMATEVLLVADTLVRSEKEIEVIFSQPEQLTILDAAPAAILYHLACVTGKYAVHRGRHTFIQKDPHP